MLSRYMAGSVSARTGDEMSGPALVLLGLAVAGSPRLSAALVAALTLTTALGGPVLGAVLDRAARPGRLLAGALVGYAGGLLVLTLLLGHAPGGPLVAVAAVTGLFGPALTAGWSSRLGAVGLDGARLRRAYAVDTASFSLAALAGPAMAGVLATALDARASALAAVTLLLLAVPFALALPDGAPHPPPPPASGPRPGALSRPTGADGPAAGRGPAVRTAVGNAGRRVSGWGMVAELRRGVRAVVTDRDLRSATTVSAVSYLGIGAATVAVPVLGMRLTGRAGAGAALLSVLAVGSLAATAALARWPAPVRPRTQVAVSTVLLAAGLAVASAAGGVPVVAAGLLVAGLADGPQLAALLVIRHRAAPDGLRAQVFGTAVSVKQAGFAAGAAVAGPVAAVSPRAALALAAGSQLVALAAGRLVRHRRR